jgi:hypothetical protein
MSFYRTVCLARSTSLLSYTIQEVMSINCHIACKCTVKEDTGRKSFFNKNEIFTFVRAHIIFKCLKTNISCGWSPENIVTCGLFLGNELANTLPRTY